MENKNPKPERYAAFAEWLKSNSVKIDELPAPFNPIHRDMKNMIMVIDECSPIPEKPYFDYSIQSLPNYEKKRYS